MPPPGRADDGLHVGISRLPLQRALRLARVGDQLGRIAGPPGAEDLGNGVSRHAAAGFDHLAHAMAAAGAQVQLQVRARA